MATFERRYSGYDERDRLTGFGRGQASWANPEFIVGSAIPHGGAAAPEPIEVLP